MSKRASGDFLGEFSQSTLENWQSEFLQLFAFVVLAALFVHKGSAESKDSDDRVEAFTEAHRAAPGTLPPGRAPPPAAGRARGERPLSGERR